MSKKSVFCKPIYIRFINLKIKKIYGSKEINR